MRCAADLFWSVESPAARHDPRRSRSLHGLRQRPPRVGDAYENGYVRVPVLIRNGLNGFYFRGSRGRVKARLTEAPASGMAVNASDATLGDCGAAGTTSDWRGAVVVLNTTRETVTGLRTVVEGDEAHALAVPSIPPLGLRKVVFTTQRAWGEAGQHDLNLQIVRPSKARARSPRRGPGSRASPQSGLRRHLQIHVLQQDRRLAAVLRRPARDRVRGGQGAWSCRSTARVSRQLVRPMPTPPRPTFSIVAPTNRRPFGFDWEDWAASMRSRFSTMPRSDSRTTHGASTSRATPWAGTAHGRSAASSPAASPRSLQAQAGPRSGRTPNKAAELSGMTSAPRR